MAIDIEHEPRNITTAPLATRGHDRERANPRWRCGDWHEEIILDDRELCRGSNCVPPRLVATSLVLQ